MAVGPPRGDLPHLLIGDMLISDSLHPIPLVNARLTFVHLCFSLIIQFDLEEVKEGEEFKVNWKEVESKVRETYPALKLTYARGDDHGGQIAMSNLRLKTELVDELLGASMTIQEKGFKFSKLEGEPLKEFW